MNINTIPAFYNNPPIAAFTKSLHHLNKDRISVKVEKEGGFSVFVKGPITKDSYLTGFGGVVSKMISATPYKEANHYIQLPSTAFQLDAFTYFSEIAFAKNVNVFLEWYVCEIFLLCI